MQAVKLLSERSGGFRVLALSATPGRDPIAVQQVVSNLCISKIEARDEQSVDVVGCLCERAVQARPPRRDRRRRRLHHLQ